MLKIKKSFIIMNRIKKTIEIRKERIRSHEFEQYHVKKQHSNETKAHWENCENVTKKISA